MKIKHQVSVTVPVRVQLIKWARYIRLAIIKRVIRVIWNRLRSCSCGARYSRLLIDMAEPLSATSAQGGTNFEAVRARADFDAVDYDSDELVSLKVSLLGDNHIGKTSFMNKYVGDEQEKRGMHMSGLNLMDKILRVRDAKIAFSIWDVGGDSDCLDHVPIACKDAIAILFMFDLTSRCTLNNIIDWYHRARKWNKTAIPILIGTKFDDFAQLPLEMQWAIITEARAYARAMKATLFFSSATHNINVNKIFKYIMAKCFNLPWKIERNLTVGEPIIDF